MDLDDTWQRIADNAISEAERVQCSLKEFAEGLLYIQRAIRDRQEEVEDEAK